jgi:hypothetical protein
VVVVPDNVVDSTSASTSLGGTTRAVVADNNDEDGSVGAITTAPLAEEEAGDNGIMGFFLVVVDVPCCLVESTSRIVCWARTNKYRSTRSGSSVVVVVTNWMVQLLLWSNRALFFIDAVVRTTSSSLTPRDSKNEGWCWGRVVRVVVVVDNVVVLKALSLLLLLVRGGCRKKPDGDGTVSSSLIDMVPMFKICAKDNIPPSW